LASGGVLPISITVIPADAVNLDCSSNAKFGDTKCAFDAQGNPQANAKPLHPYVSVSRELFLLSGVFEDPNVNAWLQRARQTGSNARVTLNCQASVLGKLSTVAVRWQSGATWGNERDVPVAAVNGCHVAP
jgi:hypothetical protein